MDVESNISQFPNSHRSQLINFAEAHLMTYSSQNHHAVCMFSFQLLNQMTNFHKILALTLSHWRHLQPHIFYFLQLAIRAVIAQSV
jgi:hypothetical protein